MKTLLVLLLIAFSTSVCAQESIVDMIWKKNNDKPVETTKNSLDLAGIQLQKGARYQYGAIGCATASVGLFIGASFMQDGYKMEKGELVKDKNKTRTSLMIGGGILAFAAVCCELYSIDLKMKAGRSIRLHANGNGGGLAYTF